MEPTFFDWVRNTFPLERTLVFLAFGVVGMVAHYFKLWAYKQTSVCFGEYMFKVQPHRTALAFVGLLGTTFMYITTDGIAQTPWGMLIGAALTTGFAADGALNSQNGEKRE